MNRTPLPASPSILPRTPGDPRALAFLAPGGPEVFHAVAHRDQVWRPDPFDVESIHGEAREVFRGLVARAGMTPRPDSGRILLLMGESGSGKTHLMRAFRNHVHGGQLGYCGYMQMTSATDHYGRYVLNNLVDSLSRAYHEPHGETTGMMRLSTAVAESSRFVASERLVQLREDDLDAGCLGRLVDAMADQIVSDERFNDVDLDLVRALLYLQRDDSRVRARVLKYLRCEDLSPADRQALGDLTPRTYSDAPERVVALLGRIMGAVESAPLVLCLDQLEDIYNLDDAPTRFRRAMSAVCDLAERVPSVVVVISCLKDFYTSIRDHLATPARARIEKDPAPIILSAKREPAEVSELISRRLEALFEPHGAEVDPADPTYPIPASSLTGMVDLPARLVLDLCREFRDRCIDEGRIVDQTGVIDGDPRPSPDPQGPATISLEQLWNDARTAPKIPVPNDDAGLASLLARAIIRCSDEIESGWHFSAEADGTMVEVTRQSPGDSIDRLLVGVCNKAAKGGGLGKQVGEVEKRTGDATPAVTPVVVRSSEFPTSPAAAVSKQIGQLVARGGRRVVVEDSDWRAIRAFLPFREAHKDAPALAAWLVAEKPLTRLESLRKILALDQLKVAPTIPIEPKVVRPATPESPPAGEPAADHPGPIRVGVTTGLRTVPVTIDPEEMVTHAAFLGAPGSGKTTVALGIIEHLLGRGIPAILVDRKGDLGRYADPGAWLGASSDPESERRRAVLGGRLDVALYTPGAAEGRPLSIAAIPPGLGAMKSAEREKTARFAASALAGMMNYKTTGTDQTRTVILAKAMEVVSQARPDGSATLPELIGLIADADPALVNAIGLIDIKLFAKLVQDLETIRHSRSELLAARGEPMDVEALLGLGSHARPGRTRLSIISTKFLGANQDIQFWASQLLMELARWTSRSPSKTLQAVVLFDEADLYLPAVGKPATKEPMENLLKRARSAGLGLMLATQSPGDFDYKCRENIRAWFLGRIKETNAINKMKPMLGEARGVDLAARLPAQATGEFHLLREGQATALRADRSLISTEQMPEADILALARKTRDAI